MTNGEYAPEEFITLCVHTGYASSIIAQQYAAEHSPLTDADFIEAYREEEYRITARDPSATVIETRSPKRKKERRKGYAEIKATKGKQSATAGRSR